MPKHFGAFIVVANKTNRSSVNYSSHSIIGQRNKILMALIASTFFLLLLVLLDCD